MIRADVHNHTVASHGLATVEEMFAAASSRKLDWYGFSEHSPLPSGYSCSLYTGDLSNMFPSYVEQVQDLKSHAVESQGPRVLLGMELDWLPDNMPWMQDLCDRYAFDFIIGGLHYVDHVPLGLPRSWGPEVDISCRFSRYDAYYEAMTNLAGSGMVDVVAHPDFIKACCYEDFQTWLARPESLKRIAAALEAMHATDTAMEVSSAGLRKPFHEPYPGPAIMRLAAKIGLTLSFGSDAHNVTDTVSHFDALAAYAASFGFSHSRICVARERLELKF